MFCPVLQKDLENFPKNDNTTVGFFDTNFFQSFFPKAEGNSSVMLICGTNDMNKAAKECAKECGWSSDNYFTF